MYINGLDGVLVAAICLAAEPVSERKTQITRIKWAKENEKN